MKAEKISLQRPEAGFTLMELLTATAVMAVLAALLLSTLAGARDQVGRTSCLNNLRQIGIASFIYAQDFGMMYPALEGSPSGPGRIRIPQDKPDGAGMLYPRYTGSLEIFGCPGSSYAKPADVRESWEGGRGVVQSAYVYRGLSGGLGNYRIDSFERDALPALMMDYNDPSSGYLNHRGEHVNILSADGAVKGFMNENGKLNIPGSQPEDMDAAFLRADELLKGK